MSKACIKPGFTIATLAMMIIGCAGPSAIVENRTVPSMDRAKTLVWSAPVEDRMVPAMDRPRAAGGVKVSQGRRTAPAQSFCEDQAHSLIHPVHFGPEISGPCPLLSWEIRMVRNR